jgi:hypothetical protein
MAVNPLILKRPSDRGLYLTTATLFVAVVFAGFFKSYFFRIFFDVPPIANYLVHLHGITMTAWVIYFVAQVALIRTKNVKLHMTFGMIGIALAALVVVVGMATSYDSQLVRGAAPPGLHPHKFFLIPAFDMVLFVLFFGGAIYYRKRSTEHKSLMLLTAVNFMGSPFSRIPLLPTENIMIAAFGAPALIAVAALGWHTWKHRKLNPVFAVATTLFLISLPARIMIGETEIWMRLAGWLAS